jgi:predicted hydrolase (HD superfamily)
MPSRDEALALMHDWVPNPALQNHMKSVEAAMRWYARKRGAAEEEWGLAGLLHDLDWEKFPEEHPLRAVDELRGRGYPEEILHAILAHRPDFTHTEPASDLDKHLLACDVDRAEVTHGAELIGIELNEHINNVILAMQSIAAELGLTGAQIAAR